MNRTRKFALAALLALTIGGTGLAAQSRQVAGDPSQWGAALAEVAKKGSFDITELAPVELAKKGAFDIS